MHGHDDEETTTTTAGTVCPACGALGNGHYSGCTILYGDKAEPARSSSPAAARYEPAMPLKSIRPSPFNHRKHFTGLEELAASIKEKGLINPPMVRPANGLIATKPKSKRKSPGDTTEIALEDFELVAGERRWRAASLAGLTTIPVIVRELSDVEVLEIQLVENVQRSDVHPLEEADGYRDLMEKHGYTVDRIVEKTGKSKATIYARLKLCDLAGDVREAFLEEKLQPSIALLIARIPDEKLQGKALRAVLGDPDEDDQDGPDLWDRPHFETVDDKGKSKAEPIPMSVREAAAYIQRKYMLCLADASFDPADADLVPEAGACSKCVFRTGNQPTLFGDVKGADVCTKPSCFEHKTERTWKIKAGAAKAAGVKVLDKDEAEKIFNSYGDPTKVTHNAPVVDPQAEVPYEVLPNPEGKRPTWEKLLGKAGVMKAKHVVAQDGTGAARTLLDKKSAVAIAEELGKVDKKGEDGSRGLSEAEKKRRAKQKRDDAIEERSVELALEQFHAKGLEPLPAKKEAAIWGWIAQVMLTSHETYNAHDAMVSRRQRFASFADPEVSLDDLVDGTAGPQARALLIEYTAITAKESERWMGARGKQWKVGLDLFGVDWKKLQKHAAERLDIEAKLVDGACPAKRYGRCQLPKGHKGDHRHENEDGSGDEWSDKNIAGVGSSRSSWPAPKGGKKGAKK